MNTQQTVPGNLFASYCKLLDPEILRSNLLAIGAYLVAYELLNESIVDQLRSFFTIGDASDATRYERNVLHLDKSPFRASMLWFQQNGTIDDADISLMNEIRRHRNELAHEIPKFLATAENELNVKLFQGVLELISKVDRWWIRNIEMDCNSEFDEVDRDSIPDEQLTSGRMFLMQLILTRTSGNTESAAAECEAFLAEATRLGLYRN